MGGKPISLACSLRRDKLIWPIGSWELHYVSFVTVVWSRERGLLTPSQYQQLRSSVCFLPYSFEKISPRKTPWKIPKGRWNQAVYVSEFFLFGGLGKFGVSSQGPCGQNHRSLHQKFEGDYIRWLWMRWVFLGQPCRPHGLEYIWCFVCLKTCFFCKQNNL